MIKTQIIKRLNEISSNFNFIYVISAVVLRDFCGTINQLASKNVQDHLNYNEVNFLMGLWVKNCHNKEKYNYDDELKIIEEVYDLMDKLHLTFITGFSDKSVIESKSPFDFFNNGLSFQESMFYSGTGAYDYQYTKWVSEKYKYDKEWLLNHKSINLDILSDFYKTIKTLQEIKLNSLKFDSEETYKANLLDVFSLTSEEIINKNKQFSGILESFTLDLGIPQNQNFTDIGDFNILSEKPIIKLPNDNLYIPIPYGLSEAIYESPFYWMNTDDKYVSQALHNRGEIAEEITLEIIERVFGKSNTLKNLIVKKNRSTTVTDIDILAFKNDKAIIFQVKSKRLTSLSKKGNLDAIKNDFKKAVKDAYEQGLIAEECLNNPNQYSFELKDKPNFEFDLNIKQCSVVTVVLDDYPSITHQTHILLGKEYDNFPVALNIFDLEVVVKYLNTPDKFIDYIERRIKYSQYFKADNELGFLGYHLKKGLKKMPNSQMVGLDNTWAQHFDSEYYGEISGIKDTKEPLKRKVGRNDPCPCGSGKKYKKCHGK